MENLNHNRFLSSLFELKNLRALTECAILIALHVLINLFSVYVGPLKITFAYVVLAVIAMKFGPVTAFFAGGASEVIGYLTHPAGAFHPGFTLSTMLTGFIMGVFLYQREIRVWRILSARLCVNVFLNILLNTYWLSNLYGKGYLLLLPERIVKNLVLIPIEVILIFTVLKTVSLVERRLVHVRR